MKNIYYNRKHKPIPLQIFVIEDEGYQLKKIKGALRSKGKNYFPELDIKVAGTQLSEEALSTIEINGDIQIVLMDWYLYQPGQEDRFETSRDKQKIIQNELINKIKFIRPEVDLYIISIDENGIDKIKEVTYKGISFISKEEIINTPELVLDRFVNNFKERMRTPFWNAYKDYIFSAKDTWHTPGHSGGSSFYESSILKKFYEYFGPNYFRGDLSVSVERLGSLLDSSNHIGEAQEKAAKVFGVNKTFFATNGSSTSNKIIIQSLLKPNDIVIVDRNCHKSVHYGIIVAGAIPIYLESKYSNKYGIFAPPSIKEIEDKITANPNAKLLILTGCTYDGLLLDVRKIVQLAHSKNLKVFVDEAWFAYSSFHPQLRPYSAVFAKADYVTHSAHKVLSAFSQASLIHINDPEFDEKFFRENFYIYTSTSPQYTMIASLDVACMQMEIEGFKKISEAIQNANKFREALSILKKIKVIEKDEFTNEFPWLNNDNVGYDPLKVLIDVSGLSQPMDEIHKYLKDQGRLEIEKTTHNTLLILITIGTTEPKLTRLVAALKDLDSLEVKNNIVQNDSENISIPVPILNKAPRESFLSSRKLLELNKCSGSTSAFLVVPYPPGIPLLILGQKISDEHIKILQDLIDDKREIHGVYENKIFVVDK